MPSLSAQIEVSDALRHEEIRCARCGETLTAAADEPKTETGPALLNLLDADGGGATNPSGADAP